MVDLVPLDANRWNAWPRGRVLGRRHPHNGVGRSARRAERGDEACPVGRPRRGAHVPGRVRARAALTDATAQRRLVEANVTPRERAGGAEQRATALEQLLVGGRAATAGAKAEADALYE